LTNAQLTETYECARETTHNLGSLLIQLVRVVDTLHTPLPVMVTPSLVNYEIPSPQVLPFKLLQSRFPNNLPSVTLEVQKLIQENLLAQQKLLEIQYVSDRAKQALLDATTALNLIQGQAISKDGEYDIPKIFYHEDEEPTTSPSKLTGSITPPSPPSALLPPLLCPPPPRKSNGNDYASPRHVPPSLVTTNTKYRKGRLIAQWIQDLPSNPKHAEAMTLLHTSPR
jgi:hypothetical protein